jgi:DNA-binding Lrp family transcriptional regulator
MTPARAPHQLDDLDRRIINGLQGGFPLSPTPFADAATLLGILEAELIARLTALREAGVLSRFGPMFDVERLGGAFCLCAMEVPPQRFEEVVAKVNAHEQVAHNYERAHRLNVWFVLACEQVEEIEAVARAIEVETGLSVLRFPRLEEYFVDLRIVA